MSKVGYFLLFYFWLILNHRNHFLAYKYIFDYDADVLSNMRKMSLHLIKNCGLFAVSEQPVVT